MTSYTKFGFSVSAEHDDSVALDAALLVQRKLRELTDELVKRDGITGVKLHQVIYKPVPQNGKDVWVRLPTEKGGYYHQVNLNVNDRLGGRMLPAATVRDLQERGVCIRVEARGLKADALRPFTVPGALPINQLPAWQRDFQPAELVVGQHGFALPQTDLSVDAWADPSVSVTHIWVCIRMPD